MSKTSEVKPLIDSVMGKFGHIYANVSIYEEEDLRQEIHEALLIAAGSYDSSKGEWFYYASKVITNTVAEAFRKNDILSRSYRKTAKEIQDYEETYKMKYNKNPSIKNISTNLNISMLKITEIKKRENFKKQSNILYQDQSDPTVLSIDEWIIIQSEHEKIKECFNQLPEKYQKVLILRTVNNVPIEIVSQKMNVSKGRISQLQKEALLELKKIWENKK